ncbi:MAG: hypothetical protein WBV73_17645 [Phormidium sp.]
MTKAGAGDWKSPLGVYERAIAEITNLREEFKAEIQALRKLQAENASLKSELRSAQAEIQNLKAELQATNERLENLVTKSKKTTDSVKKAQETADSAISEIGLLKTGIENGSIIAQKALMLRGKDDYHWMKFKKLDSVNHHCFQVWKSDDNTWHNDIRVKASTFLRARDDNHWMGFRRIDHKGNDVFDIWKVDNTWHSNVRVEVATKLR